jgi:hypothetical protein
VGELQKQVSDLEARLATAELERKTVATLMHEAAERLKLENQEDLRRKEVEPPRQKLDDVIPELAAMRKAQSLNSK